MKTSAIVCTYRAPASLDLVLAGLLRQSRLPDEIIVADDGSMEQTAQVVRAHAARGTVPLRHLWHEDRGIRKAGIVNAGMSCASGDLLLFIDGDMVPHRHWLRDHADRFDGRTVWQGRRVRLREARVQQLDAARVNAGWLDSWRRRFLWSGLLNGEVRSYHLAIPLPASLVALFEKRKGLMGCNFSAPRSVLERVNGYDAGWEGAGYLCEDFDLEVRLRKSGALLRPILHAGMAFHLDHPPRSVSERALALRAERAALEEVRASDGIAEAGERLANGEIRDLLAGAE